MSKYRRYDHLDGLIQQQLKVEFAYLFTREIRDECDQLAKMTGRQAFRILNGRLQALKKAGVIEYVRPHSWRLKKTGC